MSYLEEYRAQVGPFEGGFGVRIYGIAIDHPNYPHRLVRTEWAFTERGAERIARRLLKFYRKREEKWRLREANRAAAEANAKWLEE